MERVKRRQTLLNRERLEKTKILKKKEEGKDRYREKEGTKKTVRKSERQGQRKEERESEGESETKTNIAKKERIKVQRETKTDIEEQRV